jgi:RNA polymerase sigma-70 factor (ECF subfamily)
MTQQDEQVLIEKVIAGDGSAFASIYNTYETRVRHAIRTIVNENDHDDIVQKVFIKVHQNLREFRAEAKLSTWIHRIAINCALEYKRSNRRHDNNLSLDDTFSTDTGELVRLIEPSIEDDTFDRLTELEGVRKAFATLSQKDQEILRLYLDDYGTTEIAKMWGVPLTTVKSALHHAQTRLRKAVENPSKVSKQKGRPRKSVSQAIPVVAVESEMAGTAA